VAPAASAVADTRWVAEASTAVAADTAAADTGNSTHNQQSTSGCFGSRFAFWRASYFRFLLR